MEKKRRLRSKYIIWGSVGALVASVCGVGLFARSDDRECVDGSMNVIDDDNCEDGRGGRWYYGGSNHGGRMSGGSFERSGFGGHGGGGG